MWKTRLQTLLQAPFELLTLAGSTDQTHRGRYLRLNGHPFGLGEAIAHGAEALVFDLIDLRHAELAGVIKICRYPPGSREYQTWAVPFRFERNRHSSRPDVELRPARLVAQLFRIAG